MKTEEDVGISMCPKCQSEDGQMKNGRNRSGTQQILCRHCRKTYTLEPKQNAYNEETRALALKTYYFGVSGRGVGAIQNHVNCRFPCWTIYESALGQWHS